MKPCFKQAGRRIETSVEVKRYFSTRTDESMMSLIAMLKKVRENMEDPLRIALSMI